MKNFNRRPNNKPQRQQQTHQQHHSRPYNDHNGYYKTENSTRHFYSKENSDVNFHVPHKKSLDNSHEYTKNVHKPHRNEHPQSRSKSQSQDKHYQPKQNQKTVGYPKNSPPVSQEFNHKKPSLVKTIPENKGSPKSDSNRVGITRSLTGLSHEEDTSERQTQMSQEVVQKAQELKTKLLANKNEEQKPPSSKNMNENGNTKLKEKEEVESLSLVPDQNQGNVSRLPDTVKTRSETTSLLEKRTKIGDERDDGVIDEILNQIEKDAQVSKKLKADEKQDINVETIKPNLEAKPIKNVIKGEIQIKVKRETAKKIDESLKALNALIEETSKGLSSQEKTNLMKMENENQGKSVNQRLLNVLNFFNNFNLNK